MAKFRGGDKVLIIGENLEAYIDDYEEDTELYHLVNEYRDYLGVYGQEDLMGIPITKERLAEIEKSMRIHVGAFLPIYSIYLWN